MSLQPIIYKPKGRALEYGEYAANLYTGCPHRCAYCYVPQCLHISREDFHRRVEPKPDVGARIARDAAKLPAGSTVFLCFTCDPFPTGYDCEATYEAIDELHGCGHFVRILTKGIVTGSFWAALKPGDELGITLTVEERADVWEPGTVSVTDRIMNLVGAKYRGLATWVSFEPIIDPFQTEWLIHRVAPYADRMTFGVANHLNQWNWPTSPAGLWRRRVETIDWAWVAQEVSRNCEALGISYRLKEDLARYLPTEQGEQKITAAKRAAETALAGMEADNA